MFLIRSAELAICKEYQNDEMKTPMHMSMGSEAISAGVLQALPKDTHAYGTYRSHALYLAMTGETDKFFGEMYGKATGGALGKAGSMHLASPENGLIATSAIVGTTISLAVGDAFEAKYNGTERMTAVFFGDGAIDEGAFWESLNLACLYQLPVMFVCEDNSLAIHISTAKRRGYDSIAEIAKKFRCAVWNNLGTDVFTVYLTARGAVDYMQKTSKPVFINFSYYRYLEHVGVNEDFNAGYRDKKEFLEWKKNDPIASYRGKLIDMGLVDNIVEIEHEVNNRVNISVEKAKSAPYPDPSELLKEVYDRE